MISAAVDQSVVERFRKEMDQHIADNKDKLVERPTEKAAGFIQGMIASMGVLDQIIKRSNDPNPQR
jgi:hypothetical protein